jgi:hypothetical protein
MNLICSIKLVDVASTNFYRSSFSHYFDFLLYLQNKIFHQNACFLCEIITHKSLLVIFSIFKNFPIRNVATKNGLLTIININYVYLSFEIFYFNSNFCKFMYRSNHSEILGQKEAVA